MKIKTIILAFGFALAPVAALAQSCGDYNPSCPGGQIFDDVTGACEDFTSA